MSKKIQKIWFMQVEEDKKFILSFKSKNKNKCVSWMKLRKSKYK